jgi:ribonuclease J
LNPDYLIIEGTNVASRKKNATAGEENVTENLVMENCLEAVRKAAGKLVVADFGARNIERLEIFLRIANLTGRSLVVTEKDIFTLHAMAQADDRIGALLKDSALKLYHREKGGYLKGWQKAVAGLYGDLRVEPETIRSSQGDYILAFGFFDVSEIIDIEPVGGSYIYSTCEAFNEEMAIDVRRLSNWIKKLGLEPVGLEFVDGDKGPEIRNIRGYHASGHVSQHELAELFAGVKPGTVIPIHTEHPEMFGELIPEDTKLILPEQGVPISLS